MEIKIKNKIKVGDQTEIIEEIHTCEVMEIGRASCRERVLRLV